MELLLVFGAEAGVGVDDADELRVGLLRKLLEEADDVAVFEADDGDAHRSGRGLRGERGGERAEDSEKEETKRRAGRHRSMLARARRL